ncbi:MAG: hypothetical protein ABIK82_15440 [Pseudomonadota bacterium]
MADLHIVECNACLEMVRLKAIFSESDTFKGQRLVLQMMLASKEICNHPAFAALPGPR